MKDRRAANSDRRPIKAGSDRESLAARAFRKRMMLAKRRKLLDALLVPTPTVCEWGYGRSELLVRKDRRENNDL